MKLYGVSVGAGGSDNMTLGAVRAIEGCRVLAVPRTGSETSFALDIARGACDLSGKEIVPLDFPMKRDAEVLTAAHRKNADILCGILAREDAVMITLGDISTYSTFCYIADMVREAGFEVVTVPGVASYSMAAAAAGIPLVSGDEPLTVIPYGCEGFEELLCRSGTRVIMKCGSRTAELREQLRSRGLLGKTVTVENCGLPTERILRGDIPEGLGYFTLFIIKE